MTYLTNIRAWLTGFARFGELTFKAGWSADSLRWWLLYSTRYYRAGYFNPTTSPLQTQTSEQTGTGYAQGWFDKWALSLITLDNVPYADLAYYTAIIDEACDKGLFVNFVGHIVGVSESAYSVNEALLQAILDYCVVKKNAGLLQFVTLEEMVAAT